MDSWALGERRHEKCKHGVFSAEAYRYTPETGESEPFAMPLCSWRPTGAHPPALTRAWGAVAFDTTQITSPTNRSQPKAGDPSHPLSATAHAPAIAFTGKDYGAAASEIAPTLRAMGHTNSHANAGGQVAVALNLRGREGGAMPELDDLASLRAASGGSSRSFVQTSTVRRLSPLECERLQGFADGFTRITVRTYRKQPKGAHFEKFRDLYEANPDGTWTRFIDDGPRYRMLGNSMAVPVMSWLGRRIAIVDLELRKAAWKWKP